MSTIPFYGGINGQSFKITKKFSNFVELIADANKGWNSSACMVGEYVAIDYGNPDANASSEYQTNKAIDFNYNGKYYNATVWQKIYTELTSSTEEVVVGQTTGAANGIGYKLIFYVAVPPFSVTTDNPGVQTLDPGNGQGGMTNPTVIATDSGDVYNFQFGLPKAWDIALDDETGEESYPGVVWVNPDANPNVENTRTTTDTKYFTFTLPYAQNFQANGEVVFDQGLQVDGQGQVVLNGMLLVDKETAAAGATVRNPVIRMHLPVNQFLQRDAITVTKGAPSRNPSAVVSYSDTNNQYPRIAVEFPRAEEYNFGILLQAESDQTIASGDPGFAELSALGVGDYYVNTTLAAVHKIVSSSSTEIRTQYLGSFWKIPDVTDSTGINPYDASGNVVDPTVVATPPASPSQPWKLTFGIPKAPVYAMSQDSGFVASTEEGQIAAAASNDTITWTLKIPKGTRFYAGVNLVDIDDMKDGDLYLRADGQVLKYNATTEQWENAENIKGAPGDDLTIINPSPIDITAAQVPVFTYPNIGAYLESQYPQYANPASNEVVNITYTPAGESNFLSHWLFKVGNTWTGAKLTGDASNSMIIDSYSANDETNKTYSVNYFNGTVGYEEDDMKREQTLIARINALETALATLQSDLTDLTQRFEDDIVEQQSWGAISSLPDRE